MPFWAGVPERPIAMPGELLKVRASLAGSSIGEVVRVVVHEVLLAPASGPVCSPSAAEEVVEDAIPTL